MSLPTADEIQRHTLPKTQDVNKFLAVTGEIYFIFQNFGIYFFTRPTSMSPA